MEGPGIVEPGHVGTALHGDLGSGNHSGLSSGVQLTWWGRRDKLIDNDQSFSLFSPAHLSELSGINK